MIVKSAVVTVAAVVAGAAGVSRVYARKHQGRMPEAMWGVLVALPKPLTQALFRMLPTMGQEFAAAGAAHSIALASGSIAAPGEGGR